MRTTIAPEQIAYTEAEHWPRYEESEIEAVAETLRSGRVNQWTGDRVRAFQEAYEQHIGSGKAIALANGSLALEIILRAYNIGAGDEVITTPRTFVASAFCAELVGATAVFADVDLASGNITAETIRAQITPRTKAIVPVHLGGWPCDMPAIMQLAREHNLIVIEDCAQAHGATIDGKPVGSFGDAAAFSFCQDKIMTTGGEGGLSVFHDNETFEWAWSFKDHGKNREMMFTPPEKPGFRWLHESVGTNWRMLETSAVLGIGQLKQLAETRTHRSANAKIWREALENVSGISIPTTPANMKHAWYKFYCYVTPSDDRDVAAARDEILARAGALGIRAFSGSCSEVYLEKAFAGRHQERLPNARAMGDSSLMFEIHPNLDEQRLRLRAQAIAEIATDVLS